MPCPHRLRRLRGVLSALVLAACSTEAPAPPGPLAISLLDRWSESVVDSPTPSPTSPPRAELRFDGSGLLDVRWRALEGIDRLRVEDGKLTGRATSATPMILLEVTEPLGIEDRLWSVEVRLAASQGERLGIHPVTETGPPLPVIVARAAEWPLSSPLGPAGEASTVTVELAKVFTRDLPVGKTAVTQVLVRPSDVAGADFALESVRLVFRKEHLGSIPSGPGWHGLGEIYRETLVARAPETLRFELSLPEKPWLDLAVGSIDETPPCFRIAITPEGGTSETVAELCVMSAEQWQPARLDLGRWAGQDVELRLSTIADRPGALAFWGAPTVRSASVPEARPQAVIVFLADTLRRDHLDAWGYSRETAPTLSRLAREGALFEDAIAQATWTKASVPSILTSLYPSTGGVTDFNDRVSPLETTLAEVFRAAGYATFATSSVPFSGQLTNLHQGVEVLYELGANGSRGKEYSSKTAKVWVDAFLEWLDRHRDVPVFALIHVMDPHMPFRPEAPYDTLWTQPGDAERFVAMEAKVEPHIQLPTLRRFKAPLREEIEKAGVDPESFVTHEKAWYDGSIRGMDAQLERLLNRLQALGLGERTLLAFVADHGEELLDHGAHWHGRTVYGEVANVPLVLWGQGVPQGKVIADTVQNLDVLPTLLELAGLEVPERAQGRSLVPLLRGESVRASPVFIEARKRRSETEEWDRFAIIDGRFKLVWNVDPPAGVPVHELYDHDADPLDQHDLAAEHPEEVARLAAQLERWRAWAEAQRLPADAAQANLSAEQLERLRSLGYL